MRTLVTIALIASLTTVAPAGRVKWSKDGKPTIEKSKKPVKGCMKPTLKDIAKGENPFQCKIKKEERKK